jgi:TatD DNase family protein
MVEDLAATLQRGAAAGVVQFVHVGCSPDTIDRAVEIARAHEAVFAAIGIHPHEAKHLDDAILVRIEALAAHPEVVAIGETGLDYHYDRSPRPDQQCSLARHIELACKLDMPLVLHIRDAHDEAMAIVRETGPRNHDPGMVHCFTGGPDEARAWLDLGFCLSFSGIATFKTAEPIRAAAILCPPDRILLETDAPYLAPVPMRGRPNEPAHLGFTCAQLAAVRGEDPHALARTAADNTRALLGLPAAP